MANITAARRDVPLFEVVEHVVGDERPAHTPVQDLDFAAYRAELARAWLAALWGLAFAFASAPDASPWLAVPAEHSPWLALPVEEEWYELVPDKTIIEAWDRALKELVAAVGSSKLAVRGYRAGSEISEEVPPMEFAQEAHNPFADFNLDVEYGGKRILEFDEDGGARILRSHSSGAPEVLWTCLCADYGAEVLKLWPAQSALRRSCSEDVAREMIRVAIAQNDGFIGQEEGAEIVRAKYPDFPKKPAMALVKAATGNEKPGPKGPRKNRANNRA